MKQKLAPEKKEKEEAKTDDLLSADEQAANLKSDLLPNIPLSNDLLYQILSADIAEQRGFEVYAFDTMMDAAKETKDPRLARRAAEIAVKARKAGDALDATRLWHKLAPQSVEAERFFLGFLVVENKLGEVRDCLLYTSFYSTKLATSRAGHVKSCLKMGGPSSKAKYS